MKQPDLVIKRRAWALIGALAVVAGLLATFQSYTYGMINQIELLPYVVRAKDAGYLVSDFFTNTFTEYNFGPRHPYALLLGWAGRVVSLPALFLVLTLASNTAVALVTGLAARDLFGPGAGLLAIPLLLAGSRTDLGASAHLVAGHLMPALLIKPLVLVTVWAALRQRPVIAAGTALVAAAFHPLIGLGTGGLAWLALAVYQVGWVRQRGRALRPLAVGGLLLGIGVLGWGIQYAVAPETTLSTDQFVDLLAHVRHPHHRLPSSFPRQDYIDTTLLLVAAGAGWTWLARSEDRAQPSGPALRVMVMLLVGLLAGCVGGYLFVEVVPTRLWTAAQPFRFLYLLNWLAVLLLAGAVARFWEREDPAERFEALALWVGAAAVELLAVLVALKALKQPVTRLLAIPPGVVYAGLMLVALLVTVIERPLAVGFGFPALLLVALLLLVVERAPSPRGMLVAGAACGALVVTVLVGVIVPDNPARGLTGRLVARPVITLDDLTGPQAALSGPARDLTPPDAVFLTPPDWGLFRLAAERAIVVDFKAFPFDEAAMIDWWQRMTDCYGEPAAGGFDAVAEMERTYRAITDARIEDLQRRYGITHAVLYTATETAYPVLATVGNYKIVSLDA